MAMGEAAGVAAALALEATLVFFIHVANLQARLRAQGADPGAGTGSARPGTAMIAAE